MGALGSLRGGIVTVYVDNARNKFGRMRLCHMLGDDLNELHAMAEALGVRRWFQATSTPHYDICIAKRIEAIKLGAVLIDRRGVSALIRHIRTITPSAVTPSEGRVSRPRSDGRDNQGASNEASN